MVVGEIVAEPSEAILGEILEYRGNGVYHIRSTTRPDRTYITDILHETCSCPATVKICIHQRICRIEGAHVIYLTDGPTRTHYLPWRWFSHELQEITACGRWVVPGVKATHETVRMGETDDVDCGLCRRTAAFRVAKREEN